MSTCLRFTSGIIASLTMLITTSLPALADRSAPDCAQRKNVLGVSRVVEADANGGLRFGRMQYKDFSFLKKGEVVLTFDDGPLRRYTTTILNALEAECTKAMFFMVGRMAVTDPEMVRELDRRGHTIATHTWSHKNLKRLSRKSAKKEMELGISAVSAALGKPVSPFFRFPYLSYSKSTMQHLGNRNAAMFSIDVDSKDYQTRNGQLMVARVLKRLKRAGKGILLFHDIQRSTATGIRALLRKLKRNGFKVVHIVSKTPVETLPEFDAIALKELARRKKSWSSRPAPGLKVNWPVSNDWLPAKEPLTFIKPPLVAAKPKKNGKTASPPKGAALNNRDPNNGDKAARSTTNPQATQRRRKTRKRRVSARPPSQRPRPYLKSTVDPLQNRIYTD